jgi:hypothetical protein
MRTSIITLLLTLFVFGLQAQEAGILKIEGTSTHKNGTLSNVIVEVYKDGEPYTETQADRFGKFELLFHGEGNYVVRASKDGYHDRYILFSTYAGEKGYKKEKYDFSLELFKLKDKGVTTAKVQEIPLIEFNPDKKNFSYAAML